jgi:hypothetical protein
MSIAGYFSKRTRELRMPRKDSLGIDFEGAVLTGEKSLQHRQCEEAIAEVGPQATFDPAGERYETVEDYDPVLRSHLGPPKK